jgi:hypothetical protein
MNQEFKQWLEEQTYTLTDIGWTYVWDELVENAQLPSQAFEEGFKWGLWRQINE